MNDTSHFVADLPARARGTTGSRRRRVLLVCGAVAFVLLCLAGLLPRLHLWNRLAEEARAERERVPTLQAAHPERAPEVVDVALPGTTEPLLTTGIFARTDGYLKARYVDIGDHVAAGQLLAEIETPELDQQLNQARATLAQGKANLVLLQADLTLARTTAKRFVGIGVGAVTQQEIDDRTTAATTAEKAVDAGAATVRANQADVDRLERLTGFERVYAPFDGIITVRNVDPGSLITAGSTQQTTQLFSLAQVDTLRIFVFVPQTYSFDVRVGQTADVRLRENPDRAFVGHVTRTAGAIDPASGTLLTEVQVPNPDGALLSGAYVTVHFKIQRANPPMLIPATALVADAGGTRVAVIGQDDTMHYRQVRIGRDYGDRVEVLTGLGPDDVIAVTVPSGLADGAKIKRAKDTGKSAAGGNGQAGSAPDGHDKDHGQ